ncbi:helix-turn-helix domain-containing protein (plasmid) [Rhodobacter capsulatus]|uniref:helix-turn-helix domain-containing protein n=1 Tax=Rhodobacter capsulatus TaxID=1061 RepID=UPI004026C1CA
MPDHTDELDALLAYREAPACRAGGAGLNLEQLARLTGISAPALSLIETAKRDARVTTLARIARALRVPLADLLEDRTSRPGEAGGSNGQGYDLGDYR